MRLECSCKSHVGVVRSINQDALYCNPDKGIFIVADGMGGHAGGEIASKMCIDMVSEQLCSLSEETFADPSRVSLNMAEAINQASIRIFERALEDSDLRGMGTTISALKIYQKAAYCSQVGDSRIYLLRAGFIYQITEDHSLVSEQLNAGIITKQEAENHQLKNVITRSVGYQEEEQVDFFSFLLEEGDYLVLCSDGLYNKVTDREISVLINRKGCGSIDDLIGLANQRGGEDNITALVVAVGQQRATKVAIASGKGEEG